MLILGLNAYHADSAACLVRDGVVMAAAEEERFRRIKHWAGLPTQAINYCLEQGGVTLGEIDHIAINRKPGVNNLRRLGFVLTHWPDPRLVLQKIRNRRKAASIEEEIRRLMDNETAGAKGEGSGLLGSGSVTNSQAPTSNPRSLRAKVHYVEHHLAHLASAFCVSGFDRAVCLSVDGFGDFSSAAWGMGQGSDILVDGRIYFPHSLGIFYSAITQFIGFPHYGDEYKVMGLAPYGEPSYLGQMREIVRVQADGTHQLNLRFFRHHTGNVSYRWENCAPEWGELFRSDRSGGQPCPPGAGNSTAHQLSDLLGPPRQKGEPLEQRHKDIARSAQAMFEEAFFALLNALHARYKCPNLALSGGCAMNSVANGKVYLRSPFRRMYLPAAAGDAGGAIGAALVVWSELSPPTPPPALTPTRNRNRNRNRPQAEVLQASGPTTNNHAYLGPEFSDDHIQALLRERLGAETWGALSEEFVAGRQEGQTALSARKFPTPTTLCANVARAIADGKVVGWFQGRMEWGPRALGNRSILGDPRRADMKEILNVKIKRRESFRPFAPSILREHVAEWFEQEDDVPFMMQVFQVRSGKRSQLPAVCHVDGSGRLQTVHRETNPLYHQLISEFHRLTGVPMILNTSFNENEPVVCRPEEALDCFLRTRMDLLVLGNYVVTRGAGGQAAELTH